jgi:hypothetical protein
MGRLRGRDPLDSDFHRLREGGWAREWRSAGVRVRDLLPSPSCHVATAGGSKLMTSFLISSPAD